MGGMDQIPFYELLAWVLGTSRFIYIYLKFMTVSEKSNNCYELMYIDNS